MTDKDENSSPEPSPEEIKRRVEAAKMKTRQLNRFLFKRIGR